MTRLLICLIFLIFFALLYPLVQSRDPDAATDSATAVTPPQPGWLALLAASPTPFPAAIPWAGVFHTMTADPYEKEKLPEADILAFIEKCLEKYEREVKGYRATLYKQEFVGRSLTRPELIEVAFKENPHSVHLKWLKNAGLASEVIYVEGQNNNNILIKPLSLLSFIILQKAVDSPEAKSSGRVTIDKFGMAKGLQRILDSWKEARQEDNLDLKYEGVYRVKEAGDRYCYKFHRTNYEYVEEDGVRTTDVIIYIDRETWLQVGTVQRGIPKGSDKEQLIGEYYFRDIELNPEFPEDYFTRSTLTKR